MTALELRGLEARHGLLPAVRGVDLSLRPGEVVALIGANGAGKTTLLRCIAGAHPASAGRILLNGRDVTRRPAADRSRAGLALVPEGRRLFPDLTVQENLLLARAARRGGSWTVATVLDAFPNLRARLGARAGGLSGGEQQAVAIGRALMTNPDILLIDELSLGLSPLAVDRVYASLEPLIGSNVAVLLVEQDLNRALAVADRVVCMLEGRMVLEAPAATVTREDVTAAYFGLRAETVPA